MAKNLRDKLQDILDDLNQSIADLKAPAYDSKWIAYVKGELEYTARELDNILDDVEEEKEPVKAPDIPQHMLCEHDKVYAPYMYTSFPPKTPWICSKCLKQGADPIAHPVPSNKDAHRVLLNKILEQIARGER